MESFTGIKRSRSTTRQLEVLVDQMLQNKNLALGVYTGTCGYLKHQKLWRDVAFKLSAFGPKKTYIQTKITWRDLKKKVRKKRALVNRLNQDTENKDPIPEFTDLDLKVLSIIDTDKSESISEREDEEEEEEEQELELFSNPAQAIPEVSMYVEQNEIVVDASGPYKTEEMAVNSDTNRPYFVDVQQPMPIAAEFSVSPSHIPSTAKNVKLEEMDDVVKGYANLQADTNRTLKEMVSMFKKYSDDRLKLLRERNEIERERNRLKLLQINMQIKNGSQIRFKNEDLNN